MKKLYFIIIFFIVIQNTFGQQLYRDFEGIRAISFGPYTGILDSLTYNPAPNDIDSSEHCAKYIRDTVRYDVIKLYPDFKLIDVSPYADLSSQAPKIQMKVYTSAPIGTQILLQLGIRSINDYPAGVHSEYAAATTVKNAWELVTFYYYNSPGGSYALPNKIDKIVILFNPNSNNRDTIFFDDITGPELNYNTSGIPYNESMPPAKLSQNNPNPAKQNTVISFQINTAGEVSLELFDMLGNSVSTILNQEMKAGSYSIPIETAAIPDGIYFYVLKMDGYSQTRRLVISKNY